MFAQCNLHNNAFLLPCNLSKKETIKVYDIFQSNERKQFISTTKYAVVDIFDTDELRHFNQLKITNNSYMY